MKGEKRGAMAKKTDIKNWREFPLMNVSIGTMLHNLTGSWRFIKPIYEDKTPACQNACPCGNDIEAWIKLIQEGELEEAYLHLIREEPFPAILGRVCFHFCETHCNRAGLDESINIRELERYVGDKGIEMGIVPKAAQEHDKSLAVMGSGPAGMSAAYFARLLGFKVTIYEADEVMGGMLATGIPAYRLPRRVVEAELELLRKLGIQFRASTRVGQEIPFEELCRSYDYIFLGVGAPESIPLHIEGERRSHRIISGLEFLKNVALGAIPDMGQVVTIIGGGNTAMDAARTAVRLGARDVTVIYRRTEAEMPAHPEEVKEAKEEGINFRFLASPERIQTKDDGSIELTCSEMALGEPDESGRRRPVRKEGAQFGVNTDFLVLAIGETSSFPPLVSHTDYSGGPVEVDDALFVARPVKGGAKVYAGGDFIKIPHTVVHAVASGKRAAIAMDCDRRGVSFVEALGKIGVGNSGALSFSCYIGLPPLNPVRQDPRKVVSKEHIVYDYFENAPRVLALPEEAAKRKNNFEPYVQTLTDAQARSESERCIHCGRCIECDNCLIFCPDVSILPKEDSEFGYYYDYDYCKGCGICFAECPRYAITMIDEDEEIKED